jgi:hypothetical protein
MVGVQIKIPIWLDKIIVWPVVMYRKIKYGYPFRRIYLGEGLYTIVDPEDYYLHGHKKWCLGAHRARPYAIRGVRQKDGAIKTEGPHSVILKVRKGRVVDHCNNNSLDNRSGNLRSATRAQNCCNKQKSRFKKTSKYIGVSYEKGQDRWAVKVKYKGKAHWGGGYKTEIEAAKAHDKIAKKYQGRFARLNFPPKELVVPCLPRRIFGLRD